MFLIGHFFNLIFLLCRGHIVAFTKVLKIYQIYHTWIHPSHHSPLSPSPTIPGVLSTDIIFLFTYMYTQYLHYIYPHKLFLYLLSLPLAPILPDRDYQNTFQEMYPKSQVVMCLLVQSHDTHHIFLFTYSVSTYWELISYKTMC
jgi:hypothetical protein